MYYWFFLSTRFEPRNKLSTSASENVIPSNSSSTMVHSGSSSPHSGISFIHPLSIKKGLHIDRCGDVKVARKQVSPRFTFIFLKYLYEYYFLNILHFLFIFIHNEYVCHFEFKDYFSLIILKPHKEGPDLFEILTF